MINIFIVYIFIKLNKTNLKLYYHYTKLAPPQISISVSATAPSSLTFPHPNSLSLFYILSIGGNHPPRLPNRLLPITGPGAVAVPVGAQTATGTANSQPYFPTVVHILPIF